MISIETLTTSNYVLSAFVAIHIALELYHYVSEWLKNKRDKKMLEHIDEHLDSMECSCDGNCKKQSSE